MLVLSRKAAEGTKIRVEGKLLVVFYVAPLGRAVGVGIRGVYIDSNGDMQSFEQSLSDGPALLPGLPSDCETWVELVECKIGSSFKARIGITAPDFVEIIRDELNDSIDDDEDGRANAA